MSQMHGGLIARLKSKSESYTSGVYAASLTKRLGLHPFKAPSGSAAKGETAAFLSVTLFETACPKPSADVIDPPRQPEPAS